MLVALLAAATVLLVVVVATRPTAAEPPRPAEKVHAKSGVTPAEEPEGAAEPTEAQRQAAEARAKAEATAKQDELIQKREREQIVLSPILYICALVCLLAGLFGLRSTVECWLKEKAEKPPRLSLRRRPKLELEPEPAPEPEPEAFESEEEEESCEDAEPESEPMPDATPPLATPATEPAKDDSTEGVKPWPWLVNVIWAYDALIAAILVKGIVSPLLNRCAVGMGGWYAFSRGDFPGKVYYHDALAPWAPAFWLWLCLVVALVASCKSGQQKDQCDKRRYDRVSLLAIWGMIAIVSLVFVSFLGATIRWGKEHPKPEPPAVVAPAESEQGSNPEKVGKAPAGANLPDLPARDLFGQRSFTFFPKEGDPTEAPKGGVFNP